MVRGCQRLGPGKPNVGEWGHLSNRNASGCTKMWTDFVAVESICTARNLAKRIRLVCTRANDITLQVTLPLALTGSRDVTQAHSFGRK